MIDYRHCSIHSLPIDIICKNQQSCIAVCHQCFLERSHEDNSPPGIRLNTHTFHVFTSFTQHVEAKLQEWVRSVTQTGSQAVFQKINCSGESVESQEDSIKMRDIAIAVIEGYQTLIKTNREVVSTNCSKDIFYHPEFLKDIYRLVIDNWRLSSAVILANFTRSIKQALKQPINFELSIRAHLVNEINQEKLRQVNEVADQIIVNLPVTRNGCKEVKESDLTAIPHQGNDIKQITSEQELQLSYPLQIRMVDSFQINNSSTKSIEGEQSTQSKSKPKTSKLIDEEDLKEWQSKFKHNLQDLEKIKKENQNLTKLNYNLTNQKINLQEDHDILKKKYDKILHESREKYTSSKKQNSQSGDPNSELLLDIVELEIEVSNAHQDIQILSDCVNLFMKELPEGKELQFGEKLKQLITVRIEH